MHAAELTARLRALSSESGNYAIDFVDLVLAAARANGASDLHLQPTSNGLRVDWRLDGVLQPVGEFPAGRSTDIVMRLKVLAELLTYRCDLPQEGRLVAGAGELETRVSTFPTLYGERAAVRFFTVQQRLEHLHELGWSPTQLIELRDIVRRTGGAVLICGPAGSGKTTTAYAMLREIVADSQGGRSVFSLEDPIEVPVAGVVQSQANPAAGFTLGTALRSLLRQDPEVILVGEIRDRETAEVFLQASLTGQLVIATFHAGSAAEAITRLLDMDLEAYQLRSGLIGVIAQRLVRRLCECRQQVSEPVELFGLPVTKAFRPVGCPDCRQTGYAGRQLIAELLRTDRPPMRQALVPQVDTRQLVTDAIASGMVPLARRAVELVDGGITSPAEVIRVLGALSQ
ncbi:MAG: GspE/PulE family protein [Pirellulales bacterium]